MKSEKTRHKLVQLWELWRLWKKEDQYDFVESLEVTLEKSLIKIIITVLEKNRNLLLYFLWKFFVDNSRRGIYIKVKAKTI